MTDRELTEEERALVRNNIGLAQFLFHKQWARLRKKADYGIEPDDLLSQAYFGLIRAAMRYRAYGEENGYSEESIASGQYFGVFARKSINGQMLSSLRKIDHVHSLVRKDFKILQAHGFGTSDKTNEELAIETGIPLDRVNKVIRQVQSKPVNLEDSYSGSPDQTIGEQISMAGSVESSALEKSLREAWVQAWDNMPDLHRVVVAMKYYIGLELPDIAVNIGQSLATVRMVHKEALDDIHNALVSKVLGA